MMSNKCSICNHPERATIENAILTLTTVGSGEQFNIEKVADQFDVSLDDLKMHAVFHTPLLSDADLTTIEKSATSIRSVERPASLTRKIGLREADILANVANEYLVTLKTLGRRINRLAQVSSIDEEDKDKQLMISKLLTKPMVDLYVGVGSEIRQTVKTMGELDRMLNGPEDTASQGLAALAAAIRQSDSA